MSAWPVILRVIQSFQIHTGKERMTPEMLNRLKLAGVDTKDAEYFHQQLREIYPWFDRLDDERKLVLVDMCTMGLKNFCSFRHMIDALSHDDYSSAAHEMMESDWAKKGGARQLRLSESMRSGFYFAFNFQNHENS